MAVPSSFDKLRMRERNAKAQMHWLLSAHHTRAADGTGRFLLAHRLEKCPAARLELADRGLDDRLPLRRGDARTRGAGLADRNRALRCAHGTACGGARRGTPALAVPAPRLAARRAPARGRIA